MSKTNKFRDNSGKYNRREAGWAWQKANIYDRKDNEWQKDVDEGDDKPGGGKQYWDKDYDNTLD